MLRTGVLAALDQYNLLGAGNDGIVHAGVKGGGKQGPAASCSLNEIGRSTEKIYSQLCTDDPHVA